MIKIWSWSYINRIYDQDMIVIIYMIKIWSKLFYIWSDMIRYDHIYDQIWSRFYLSPTLSPKIFDHIFFFFLWFIYDQIWSLIISDMITFPWWRTTDLCDHIIWSLIIFDHIYALIGITTVCGDWIVVGLVTRWKRVDEFGEYCWEWWGDLVLNLANRCDEFGAFLGNRGVGNLGVCWALLSWFCCVCWGRFGDWIVVIVIVVFGVWLLLIFAAILCFIVDITLLYAWTTRCMRGRAPLFLI